VYPFGFVWFRVRSACEVRAAALWKDSPRSFVFMCHAEGAIYEALSRTKKHMKRRKNPSATGKDLQNTSLMIGREEERLQEVRKLLTHIFAYQPRSRSGQRRSECPANSDPLRRVRVFSTLHIASLYLIRLVGIVFQIFIVHMQSTLR
jgi:hypothetical protein